jgi:hypothetical protein
VSIGVGIKNPPLKKILFDLFSAMSAILGAIIFSFQLAVQLGNVYVCADNEHNTKGPIND